MTTMQLDQTDKQLVNLLQTDFPLTAMPFADLATQLGLDESDVLRRVSRLKDESIIRIIGPVFNSRALGYQSTLVALRVAPEKIERAAAIINAHPGVGHDYQRDHHYNLWFTLAIRGDTDLAETLADFDSRIHPQDMLELPVVRLFKIRLFFDLGGNGTRSAGRNDTRMPRRSVVLSEADRAAINVVQRQLPVISRPFDAMAQEIDMPADDFLAICRSLRDRGIMRRFGVSIEHQRAGFTANAMVCWAVSDSQIESVGQKMAAFPEVTHCYERKTSEKWPHYNIFTMIHGREITENEATVSRMMQQTGIVDYQTLTTVREFKKQRVRYRV